MDYKFPKVKRLSSSNRQKIFNGSMVEITEKVDGANFSFFRKNDNE